MATIGNNGSAKNAELRDAFFESEAEQEHLDELNCNMKYGRKIDNIMNKLNTYEIVVILNKINERLPKNLDSHTKEKLNSLRFFLQNADFTEATTQVLYKIDNNIKRIYAEAIIECIEEGLFDEEKMTYAENFLSLVLGSIEDYQAVMEKEKLDEELER